MRSAETFPTDEREISRLPREVIRCVHGVSDRAGSACVWPWRRIRSCLPHTLTASAPRKASGSRPRVCISRLNTRPSVPLSTLHLCPHGQRRMTRGQRGWLCLHSSGLSPFHLADFAGTQSSITDRHGLPERRGCSSWRSGCGSRCRRARSRRASGWPRNSRKTNSSSAACSYSSSRYSLACSPR